MNRILVEIFVPIAGKSFETFLPLHLFGYETIQLIIKIAADLSGGLFVASEETALCRKEDGSILNLNQTVWKLELKNGDKLLLI